jgi:sigma-B regulation protein RsbU (phosphoserine phosphatase)
LGFLSFSVIVVLAASLLAIVLTVRKLRANLALSEAAREAAQAKSDELVKMMEAYLDNMRVSFEEEMSQRSKLEHELALAQRIQMSILPKQWEIANLEIAANMMPATEVGGDYYDILPSSRGGWIAIGDVSGHGVSAGLIMMMLQSITATLVDAFPEASPRELVVAINRTLFANVRHRLALRDFVTFTLLRYEGGKVTFAGAHEDIIVWRAATKKCERISTPGTWIGAIQDLGAHIVENELVLEPGDLLVLYTDGIVEAPDANRDRFGMDRLCEKVEALAAESPETVATSIIASARVWCSPNIEDDMSIIVARQR